LRRKVVSENIRLGKKCIKLRRRNALEKKCISLGKRNASVRGEKVHQSVGRSSTCTSDWEKNASIWGRINASH
jgi:hypothetical protein